MDLINTAIHGIDVNGKWKKGCEIRREIVKGIKMIEEALISSRALSKALKLQKEERGLETVDLYEVEKDNPNDGLNIESVEKLFKQIPNILDGMAQWQVWTKRRLNEFITASFEQDIFPQIKPIKVKSYLLYNLLPLIYWQTILQRTSYKKTK